VACGHTTAKQHADTHQPLRLVLSRRNCHRVQHIAAAQGFQSFLMQLEPMALVPRRAHSCFVHGD